MKKRVGDHPRNTSAMRAAARCGAQTRAAKPCQAPAVNGKRRCRMHGGAKGSGAPVGNSNALKHGMYTRDELAFRKELAKLMRQSRETLSEFE